MSETLDLIIIGAGAAGVFTAINMALNEPNSRILIIEGGKHPLAKVKISGGGRCNVTHSCFQPNKLVGFYPRGSKKLQENFKNFGPREVIEWFKSHGVELKTEADGRIFPTTDQSETIIECFRGLLKRFNIQLKTTEAITQIQKNSAQFLIESTENTYTCNNLVLATGGAISGYKLASQLGHHIIPPAPSLFTFKVNDKALTQLSGLSVPFVKAKLIIPSKETSIQQDGPLLITHWGLSGPCILKLSAWGARELKESNYNATLLIDWFPEQHSEALRGQLIELKNTSKALIKNWPIELPQRLWEYLLKKTDVKLELTGQQIKDKTINQLSEKLKQWPINVNGKGIFKEEFVTAGGINLDEINLKTYESLLCSNLYAVGELLNIDGVTGGFNFQNAWTSGYLAAQSISQKLAH